MAFNDKVDNKTATLQDWRELFVFINEYTQKEPITSIIKDYQNMGDDSIISICSNVLKKPLMEPSKYAPPVELINNIENKSMVTDLYNKLGDLNAQIQLEKAKGLTQAQTEVHLSAKSIVLKITSILLLVISTNTITPRSNAKEIDIRTILWPDDLVIKDMN